MRQRIVLVLSCGALALALSACGGPTDASVIARGNAICSQALGAVRNVSASVAGVSAAAQVVETEARALRSLPRPETHRAVLTAFISAEQTLARRYGALAAAERGHDTSAATRAETALARAAASAARAARSYGLARCAAAGPTVGS